MITTDDTQEFMDLLDPGDVLVFSGTDPFDRLLQWIDGTSYNHVGLWLGDLEDRGASGDLAGLEANQTIHAGLSARSLTAADKEQLLDRNVARRRGTVWLIPLSVLLKVRSGEVGGGLQFDAVTAMRWFEPSELDVDGIVRFMLAPLDEANPIELFDYHQLVDLADFWIKRAYMASSVEEELSAKLTLALFDRMKDLMQAQADLIGDDRKQKAGDGESRVTTCARFVHDAFAGVGSPIQVPLRHELEGEVPATASETRDWITPNDVLHSASFRPVAHWTRSPSARTQQP
ncbi:MAG: hypothetical protein AAGA93_16510 [Actinomycetota bacterium]